MRISINTNFPFTVSTMRYLPDGELEITLESECDAEGERLEYRADLGDGRAEARPRVSLLGYARRHAERCGIKEKTRSSYRYMCERPDANPDEANSSQQGY